MTRQSPSHGITVNDVIELAEMLAFIDSWITDSGSAVEQSFDAFIGSGGYTLIDLQFDLNRFANLLSGIPPAAPTGTAENGGSDQDCGSRATSVVSEDEECAR